MGLSIAKCLTVVSFAARVAVQFRKKKNFSKQIEKKIQNDTRHPKKSRKHSQKKKEKQIDSRTGPSTVNYRGKN